MTPTRWMFTCVTVMICVAIVVTGNPAWMLIGVLFWVFM